MIGHPGAERCPSPNAGTRRAGARPDMVVLHYTAMQGDAQARDWLCNPDAQVSAHYVIGRDGHLWQLVDEAARAWHAGAGGWGAVDDVNSRSVGIELCNDGAQPFAAPLMDTLEDVLRGILARWAIPPARVVAHSDTAPGRKIDPGPRFDWLRLARGGLAVWAGPEGDPEADFDACARAFGYRADIAGTDAVRDAFRLRFRPGATGPVGPLDRATMSALAVRHPCGGLARDA